ncbi:MAG: glycosyltransferase family 1 protein [Acidobacteriaceae bacterium]|nr:glycosyltransferase family 1 protein [Acidobacteriaceae bacterium]
MGQQEYRFFPSGCYSECAFYCYDCWPPQYEWWEDFFARYRPRTAFFTARDAAAEFARRRAGMQAFWLPEAVDPNAYFPGRDLKYRRIHVLELGRRHERIHQTWKRYLENRGYVHLYELEKGKLVFPTHEDFINGLSESVVSVCFPSSMTHPERSGNTETVTHRFFESMASKCLIVGHAPQELIDLFGYNPIVELKPETCVEEIERILQNVENYQPLVDKNYSALMQKGTWDVRVKTMLHMLGEVYA